MELLLLKRNRSEIARKLPSNVTYSSLCLNIDILISDVLIQGYIYNQHDKFLDFFATVQQNASEHCFTIIGKSCLSSGAIIFGHIAVSH